MARKILIIIISMLIVFLIIFAVNKIMTSYVIKSEIPDKDWLKDNCECIERENLKCPGEFNLDVENRICRKETLVCSKEIVLYEEDCETRREWTNVLLGCSQYNCSGEVYEIK